MHKEKTQVLHAAMEGLPKFRWTFHAKERMKERCITAADIWAILSSGTVVTVQSGEEYGGEKWVVEGKDLDNRWLRVVVRVLSDASPVTLVVITAIVPNIDPTEKRDTP